MDTQLVGLEIMMVMGNEGNAGYRGWILSW